MGGDGGGLVETEMEGGCWQVMAGVRARRGRIRAKRGASRVCPGPPPWIPVLASLPHHRILLILCILLILRITIAAVRTPLAILLILTLLILILFILILLILILRIPILLILILRILCCAQGETSLSAHVSHVNVCFFRSIFYVISPLVDALLGPIIQVIDTVKPALSCLPAIAPPQPPLAAGSMAIIGGIVSGTMLAET
eukprot:3338003-Rhodomonas_salina.2